MTMHHRPALAMFILLGTACADEVVAPPGDGDAACVGPTWTYEHDLGSTRWNDAGGAAAESGDVVLVVWQDRQEETDFGEVHGRFLDAATGEPRGDVASFRSGIGQVWVRAVDSGFVVFVQSAFTITVFSVASDGATFVPVATYPRGDLGFTAVATDAGVLAFGEGEILHIGHDGRLAERRRDGLAGELLCRTSTALPDGRVAAWCGVLETGEQRWLTLDADGANAVATPLDAVFEWPPVMAASDIGVFVVLPVDEEAVHVALFDHDGRPLVAPVPVELSALAGGADVSIMGVSSCMTSCEGLGIVVRGNRAILEVMTMFPARAERFDVVVNDDATTISTRGTREVRNRQNLTATSTTPLSTWTRYAPHLPIVDLNPPFTLVVERPCLRAASDG